MGYYTRFELEVNVGRDNDVDYEEVVEEITGYHPFDDETKWYSFEEDMKSASKLHPKALFELSGEGEESGDIWKAYFRDGKMQMCRAKIVVDRFDESLMK